MSQPTYPRPVEPLVSNNQFRQQTYTRQNIPAFSEIKSQLPEPVLPDKPEWLEMYWRAWEMAWSHLRRPRAGSSFIANYLTPVADDHLFMGDSAFVVQFGVYGRRLYELITMLDNFYARQQEDGYICREIAADGQDYFYPFDPNGTGPNILAWAEWRVYRATGDDERLAAVFWPLLALHRWCRAHRTWPNGLYWATGLSSGMDNQPRVPDSRTHHQHWSWIDASAQACLNCYVLEQMATLLSQPDLAAELNVERSRLIQLINEQMWNAETNFYQDVSPDGRFSPVKSIGAYWALLAEGLVPENRLTPFVQHLRDQWSFKLPHRIPSQS
ncbi:MAG: glycoside hydrolase, partial [Anaerolineae bacterium]